MFHPCFICGPFFCLGRWFSDFCRKRQYLRLWRRFCEKSIDGRFSPGYTPPTRPVLHFRFFRRGDSVERDDVASVAFQDSSTSPVPIRPGAVVEQLLELADRLAERGAWWEARAAYCAAIAADETPFARLVFAGFLTDSGAEDEALGQFFAAWERSKAGSCDLTVAICCDALAAIYRRLGDGDQAARFQQRAIRAWCDAQRTEGHPVPDSVFRGLGWDALGQGNLQECLAWLRHDHSREQAFDCGEAAWIRAEIALNQAKPQTRSHCLMTAYQSYCQLGDLASCALVLMEIGKTLLDRRDWRGAARCFHQAGGLHRDLRNKAAEADSERWEKQAERWSALEYGDPQWN